MTNVKETADKLLSLGYQLCYKDNNTWTFINTGKINFSQLEGVVYTNKLMFS